MDIKIKLPKTYFLFSFLKATSFPLHPHKHKHTHTHKLLYANYTKIYTSPKKFIIEGATYKLRIWKIVQLLFLFLDKKQIKNTFSFVFKRYSQIKSKDFRFLQFSFTEQILDELFCKFHFCLIFTEIGKQNRNNTRWAPTKHTIRKYKQV